MTCLRHVLLGLVCLGTLSCDRTPTRASVLSALVQHTLVPAQIELAAKGSALTTAARALEQNNDSPSLAATRSAWHDALLAWERMFALRVGPIVDNSGLLRAKFWPVREHSIEALLALPQPPSEQDVDQLGVDVRGLYALEWLLFGEPSRSVLSADTAQGKQVRATAVAFAANAQSYADDAQRRLGDGSALTASLVAAPQENVSRLVNQMVATVEGLASSKLAPVIEMHAQHDLRAREVQGMPSGVSSELVSAQLRETERLYVGTDDVDGLASIVKPVAPLIDQRIRERFDKANKLVERLGGPLEQVVERDRARVQDAFRALKELEMTLKVDLASALGVTMTFTVGDGD